MSEVEVVDLKRTLVYVTCNCFDMTIFFGEGGGGEDVKFGVACKVVIVLDCILSSTMFKLKSV